MPNISAGSSARCLAKLGMRLEVMQMSSGREGDEFFRLGVHYYVAARSAVMAQLLPTCGNLYHHALEMFLKAGLSRRYAPKNLKKFGHNLQKMWTRSNRSLLKPENSTGTTIQYQRCTSLRNCLIQTIC